MPISGEQYRNIGRAAAGAVSVVAADARDASAVVALTVSSFVTLSFEPPLVMFAIQHNADSYSTLVASKAFGVSLLASSQCELAQRFARKGRDKTLDFGFERGGRLAVPLVPQALAQIECSTNQIVMSGDHAIVIGLVEGARTREGEPLLYFARHYGTFQPLP